MKKRNRVAILNIISTFLLKGISIFTAPIFSRLLGTGGYGVMSTYNIWVGLVSTIGTSQTQITIPNARIEYPIEDQRRYQSSIMGLSVTLFACVSFLVLAMLPWVSDLLRLSPMLIGLLLVHSFGSFCVAFLNTKFIYELKAGRNMITSVLVTLSTLALSLILVLQLPKEINYYGRIWGNALVYGILGISICVWVLSSGKTYFSRKYWRFALVLAIPLALQSLSDQLLGHSDLLMLRHMKGDSVGGMYGLAYNFAGIMFAIFTALNNSWTPFFFEENRLGHREQVVHQAGNFAELYTVLSAGFILLALEVFKVFAGREFWEGSKVIPVFVTSYYLNFLCTLPVNYEYYHKKTNMVAAATILAAFLNIGINALLIPRFGIMGAAVASCISHGVQFSLHYSYARSRLGRDAYPFKFGLWGKYALLYGAVVILVYLAWDLWFLRWGLGALLGIWELWRIKKRGALI